MPADRPSSDPILFSSLNDVSILKLNGRGSMNNVHCFVSVCKGAIEAGQKKIVIDFESCNGLDSTFMGSLIEIEDNMKEKNGELLLIRVNDKVRELLDMLGILEIVKIDNTLQLPKVLRFEIVTAFEISDSERIRLIHSAHKKLVESNPDNLKQFGNFLKALESEIGDL